MIELQKDLTILLQEDPTALFCVTTNIFFDASTGLANMGGGTAGLFRKLFQGIDLNLGKLLAEGNHGVCRIWDKPTVVAFPTINDIAWTTTIELVIQSTKQLIEFVQQNPFERIYLPRPGAAIGSLPYETTRPILQEMLDDRFIIVSL